MVKTLGPGSWVDVFYVGHDYCEGNTVVMDLAGMAGPDAAPLVAFTAGPVGAQSGAMDRVPPGTFLLVPPGMLGPGAAGHPVGAPV